MISSRLVRLRSTYFGALSASLLLPSLAEAHVKWFCAYSIAGQPEGLANVLCSDFEWLVALAVGVIVFAALVDRSFVGAALTRALDRVTAPFTDSSDVMIRAVVGFFLISLWSIGGTLLTPELKTSSTMIPWFQLAMAACLLSRKTMVVTAVGIVVLFGLALKDYGYFHLADYPIFIGLAAYLAAVGLGCDIFGVKPLDLLRGAIAITLMWASVEKWAYPEWSYPLFVSHPEMSAGFEPAFFMRAAGVVEFSMSFALICSPLMRRCGAIMLAALFISAVISFGKVDAIGHAPIIGALFAIIIDPTKEERVPIRRMAGLPFQYAAYLAIFIGLYYGMHMLEYGRGALA